MPDIVVPGGVYSEEQVRLLIASVNDLSEETILQKLDKLGVSLEDYLAICEDERFREGIINHAFFMFVIPNTGRFINRHMQAAMKGGRGSARVILKLWSAFNKSLEHMAYDKRGGDRVYLDLRQMSAEQLSRELQIAKERMSKLQSPQEQAAEKAFVEEVEKAVDAKFKVKKAKKERSSGTSQENRRSGEKKPRGDDPDVGALPSGSGGAGETQEGKPPGGLQATPETEACP